MVIYRREENSLPSGGDSSNDGAGSSHSVGVNQIAEAGDDWSSRLGFLRVDTVNCAVFKYAPVSNFESVSKKSSEWDAGFVADGQHA